MTLPHDHIVRSVDMGADGLSVVTGGQEKKIRLFDLEKPTEPQLFRAKGSGDNSLSHDLNIRSVVYDQLRNLVISADDKTLRWGSFSADF